MARILPNSTVQVQELAPAPAGAATTANEQWNIVKIRAPDVWALGYTGQGAVVGSQDTGFQWNHPALINQYRGWDGTNADHNYNWHDAIHSGTATCGVDSQVPCDGNGHGTHTLGVALGDDGLTNHIGVAPGAKWMGCRCMDDNANGTPATYTECFEWFMSPTDLNGQNPDPSKAPDVINNSWLCTTGQGCTDPLILSGVVNNVRAAGIVVVAAAGNSGPGCSTITTPAAIYGAAVTVGATGTNDVIDGYSSRGPVTVDGSNRTKPDVCAPGDAIYSSVPPSSYSVANGTSNAGPHVAGLVALLLSIHPELKGQVDTIENLIEQSAVPLTITGDCAGLSSNAVPNNAYGWGRIDTLAAYTLATDCPNITASISGAPGTPICDGATVNLTASGSNGVGALSYNWTTNGIPFATTRSITDNPAPGINIYEVTVTDTNGCSSGPASVMVTIGPAITGQPANQTVLAGSTATFTVQATGVPPLLYQWQSSVNNGSTWSSLSGATNSSDTTPALAASNSGTQFRAIVSETCGSPATSSVAVVIVATTLAVPSAYAQAVVDDGPFAYWRLNETSNGTAVAQDFYGVYNGTIGQAVTPEVPGPQAPAFPGFETTNTAMRLSGAAGSSLIMPALFLNTNTVTMTGWMNPSGTQSAWAGVLFCRGGTTVSGLNFGPGSPANELRYTWNNNQYDVSTGLIVPTNQWSFFALVVTPNRATIYLGANGVLNSFTNTTPLGASAFDAPLMLGEDTSSGGRYYAGALDEVAIFNQSLSAAQVQQLYSNALVAPPPSTGFQQWQDQYFGSTSAPNACATCDADGTGQNNLFKYVAGLDPTNPASIFVLKIAPVGGQPGQKNLLYNPIAAGRTYTVQVNTNLVGGVYTNLTSFSGPTTNITQAAVTDLAATKTNEFYRIRISYP